MAKTEYTSKRIAAIAGKVLAGKKITDDELKALAASALTQTRDKDAPVVLVVK